MLILEVILTVVAWKKGWRGWALVPVAGCLLLGFIIGVALGAAGFSGAQVRQAAASYAFLDFGVIGILIWMAVRGRKRVLTIEPSKEIESPQVVTSKI